MKSDHFIDAVLFDMDGTLTDTEKYYKAAWSQAIEHFGYTPEPGEVLKLRSLGKPFALQQFRQWFGEDFPYDEVRNYRTVLFEKMVAEQGVHLKPGADELLSWLSQHGYTVALVTAVNLERAEKQLESTGIRKYFDSVCSAHMVRQGKPAPDVYLSACRELDISPDRVLAVEDSPNGVQSAFAAGCHVVMVPDLTPPDDDLRGKLYACVDSLVDIIGLLEQPVCREKGPFINFSNHPSEKWSEPQAQAAYSYGGTIVDMPFPPVDPHMTESELSALADRTAQEILAVKPSAVMCQGEFGLSFAVAQRLLAAGVIVLHACSERNVHVEGNVKSVTFDFVQFRKYERYGGAASN